ncbi:MAG TPA: alpha/beta hydrolase [Opitutaceae bacterium]|nr:alpha/beta hydrolase [Opitutaceae bacterium]
MKLRSAIVAGLIGFGGAIAARANWATVNGHRLYYERHGAGQPLVLLHGGGNSIAGSFRHQIADFSAAHEVIGIEQVGQGHSPDVPGPLTYGGMAEDTASLLRQLNVTHADIVGWSDGGIIGLVLAVRYPDLVRRLVVSGANVDPLSTDPASARDLEHPQPGASPLDEKLRVLWLDSPKPTELTFDLLHRIKIPVLVMSGDRDAITLDETIKIYRALPHAELWVLPNTGHATFNTRPDWVNPRVLEFLDQ